MTPSITLSFFLCFIFSLFLANWKMALSPQQLGSSSFECGFQPEAAKKTFSLGFFTTLLIFILFDLELMILALSVAPTSVFPHSASSLLLIQFLLLLTLILSAEYLSGFFLWS